MRYRLGSVLLGIISFILGLRARELVRVRSLQLHPLEIRQPQVQPSCAYSASHLMAVRRNKYTFSISLPGIWWSTFCPEHQIMKPILDAIEFRCMQKWSKEVSLKSFEGQFHATLVDDECLVGFQVTADSEMDHHFPEFIDDCIVYPPPEACGLSQNLPWPSKCYSTEVTLRLKTSCQLFAQILESLYKELTSNR